MDEDLGGDDVKLLGYTIVFTKRDAETVLQAEREEIVDFPTDAGAFAGLKVAEFLERLQRDGIPWPAAWKGCPGDGYPAMGQSIRHIPAADQKYVTLTYSVKARQPIPDAEHDKSAQDMLRRIREGLV
jgi:hypothetical protein